MNRTRKPLPARSRRRPTRRPPLTSRTGKTPRPGKSTRSPIVSPRKLRWRWFLLLMLMAPALFYLSLLDIRIREQFEGKRWAIPARVYARPMELFTGMSLSDELLSRELQAIGYKSNNNIDEPGSYGQRNQDHYIHTRRFQFWDNNEPARRLRVRFQNDKIAAINDVDSGENYALMRLEPRLIGKIYPSHREDRILVQLAEDVPQHLIDALIATEDRQFFEHNGISFRGIARAFFANITSGRPVQGGSTITQQLIKNFYLSSERTFNRKINEAIMALLLEFRYSKQEILEAYLNEVYLGQDGDRAIHGFGLAAWFYFDKPLEELNLSQAALLVALVKAASIYNPRRFPENAINRRNLVLAMMRDQGKITAEQAKEAQNEPLNIVTEIRDSVSPYPAFLSVVRYHLHEDYREEDLRSEGLQIFTTLDPIMQLKTEESMVRGIRKLERENHKVKQLQGAMVITETQSGEIVALANGRDPRFAGFNRPLNAKRQIGSLIKVATYLAALEDGKYSLNTILDDSPYEWVDRKSGEVWKPRNYDRRAHGQVSLHKALANSYNLAAVRLGMSVGLKKVKLTMQRMGLEREFNMYPSTLLGSINMSPLEVAQMYQTLASGGFKVPLRSIREVLDHHGKPLQRYPISVEQRFNPESIFLLNYALQQAVERGTGKAVYNTLRTKRTVAGKTGTSNDLRDSWFAAYDSQYLTVTWLGRDDNNSIHLSGGDGAAVVWGEFFNTLHNLSQEQIAPQHIQWRWVDYNSGRYTNRGSRNAILMPFVSGKARLAEN
jgi:penicillin-binding protein 1B